MGADIHMFIEYAEPDDNGEPYWRSFGGEIYPARDYNMFGLLAGVRRNGCMYPPRGLPDNIAYAARAANTLRITKSGDEEGTCTRTQADDWVARGISTSITDNDGKMVAVTHPDWHSRSWLTSDEFSKVMTHFTLQHGAPPPAYYAVQSALDALHVRGMLTRVVFWFDN